MPQTEANQTAIGQRYPKCRGLKIWSLEPKNAAISVSVNLSRLAVRHWFQLILAFNLIPTKSIPLQLFSYFLLLKLICTSFVRCMKEKLQIYFMRKFMTGRDHEGSSPARSMEEKMPILCARSCAGVPSSTIRPASNTRIRSQPRRPDNRCYNTTTNCKYFWFR